MGVDGKVTSVKCKVYNVIEGKNKMLVPKLDSLWKHVGPKKATIASMGVAMFYIDLYYVILDISFFCTHFCFVFYFMFWAWNLTCCK
jgi:hypothetical protein